MAKHVFSKTQDVAQQWAKGELDWCRTGSNTSMRDGVLFSYGTAIAKIVTNRQGQRVALISSHQWSSGTSKVQGEARAAAHAEGLDWFDVPHLGATFGIAALNNKYYAELVRSRLERLARGRVASAPSYRDAAQAILERGREYARQFDCDGAFEWLDPEPRTVKHPKEA